MMLKIWPKFIKKIAFKLCEQLIGDDFLDMGVWKKWHSKDEDGIINKKDFKSKEERDRYSKEIRDAFEKEEALRQETLNELCNLISKKLFFWRD